MSRSIAPFERRAPRLDRAGRSNGHVCRFHGRNPARMVAALCLVALASLHAYAQAPDPRVTDCVSTGGSPEACAAAVAAPQAAPSPAPAAPAPVAATASEECATAETDWQGAERQATLAAYQRHLVLFPTCATARLARARIAALQAAPSPAPTAPAAPAAPTTPVPPAAAAPASDDCATAEADWQDAERQATLSAYQRHLALFPFCATARLARERIATLTSQEPSPTTDPRVTDCVKTGGSPHTCAVAAPQAAPSSAPAAPAPPAVAAAPASDECATAEADWQESQRQATLAAYQRHLALFPSCPSARLARERIARLTNQELTRSAPPPSPTVAHEPADLARRLQVRLKSVGCDPGSPTGEWNAASIRALEAFNPNAGTKLDVKVASLAALDAVSARIGRVCPLVCAKGQKAEGDQCVRITCAAGSHLDADSVCRKDHEKAARPPARAAHAPAAPAHGRGSRCFNLNGQRFCE